MNFFKRLFGPREPKTVFTGVAIPPTAPPPVKSAGPAPKPPSSGPAPIATSAAPIPPGGKPNVPWSSGHRDEDITLIDPVANDRWQAEKADEKKGSNSPREKKK